VRFTPLPLAGAYVVELEEHTDDRGFFARAFGVREFGELGLRTDVRQCNLSYNHVRGTLRGMHYQAPPATEAKLVRCISGAIWNVLVDVRPDSATRYESAAVELSAANRRALYVPDLFAVGYQTLEDATAVYYQVSEFYTPEAERGIRWDDPQLGIDWPLPVSVISAKDQAWPLLDPRP
jgi:dTDP-4-dehydrorhamnose 3,5-epimerase